MTISQAVYEGQIMMIADLQSQLAEAQQERDRNKEMMDGYYHEAANAYEKLRKAEAELAAEKARADRLEAAIEKADHDDGCASLDCVLCDADVLFHEGPCYKPKPCDCWKREALEGG